MMSSAAESSLNSRLRAASAALALVVATVMGVIMAGSAGAANGEILADQIVRDGCVVTIPVEITESGDFTFDVWDDDVKIFSDTFSGEEGEVYNVMWTITSNINQGAPGVGFSVVPGGSLDPWDFEGSDSIVQACADSEGSDSGEGPGEEEPPAEETTTTTVVQPAPTGDAAQPVIATPSYTG